MTIEILRLRLIVQNNRLKEEIECHGYTQESFVKLLPFSYQYLSEIINLRRLPTEEQQIAIACVLEKPIDYIFPDSLLESVRRKTFQNRTKLLDENQVKRITGPPLLLLTDGGIEETEEKVNNELLNKALEKALSRLKQRERRVIELRFGLKDGYSHTLKDTGLELGLSPPRIAQIEVKALRKLRHPSRSRLLTSFLDEPDLPRKRCSLCNKYIDFLRLQKHPRTRLCQSCFKPA